MVGSHARPTTSIDRFMIGFSIGFLPHGKASMKFIGTHILRKREKELSHILFLKASSSGRPTISYLRHDSIEPVLSFRPLLGVQTGCGVQCGEWYLNSDYVIVGPLNSISPNAKQLVCLRSARRLVDLYKTRRHFNLDERKLPRHHNEKILRIITYALLITVTD